MYLIFLFIIDLYRNPPDDVRQDENVWGIKESNKRSRGIQREIALGGRQWSSSYEEKSGGKAAYLNNKRARKKDIYTLFL